MSLQALCEEIASEKNISERTLRRRFEKMLDCAHGNVEHIKNGKGKILFEGEQIKFTRTLLIALADDNSETVKFINMPGVKNFGEVNRFIQKLLEHVTENVDDDKEIQAWVNYVCMIFMVPWHNAISRCHKALDSVFTMYRDLPYTHQSILSEELESIILRICTSQLVQEVDYVLKLAEFMLKGQEISETEIDYFWYGGDETAREYAERDRRVYAHLRKDDTLRHYVENKIGKTINEIFPVPAKEYE